MSQSLGRFVALAGAALGLWPALAQAKAHGCTAATLKKVVRPVVSGDFTLSQVACDGRFAIAFVTLTKFKEDGAAPALFRLDHGAWMLIMPPSTGDDDHKECLDIGVPKTLCDKWLGGR